MDLYGELSCEESDDMHDHDVRNVICPNCESPLKIDGLVQCSYCGDTWSLGELINELQTWGKVLKKILTETAIEHGDQDLSYSIARGDFDFDGLWRYRKDDDSS